MSRQHGVAGFVRTGGHEQVGGGGDRRTRVVEPDHRHPVWRLPAGRIAGGAGHPESGRARGRCDGHPGIAEAADDKTRFALLHASCLPDAYAKD